MRKTLLATTLLVFPLTFGAGSIALAQDGAKEQDKGSYFQRSFFERYDTAKDGKVTREEFLAVRGKSFDEIDANNDGVIDREEIRAHWKSRMDRRREARFDRLDTDKDGKLSEEEWLAPYRARFKALDKAGDGFLSKEEYFAARSDRARRGDRAMRSDRAKRGDRAMRGERGARGDRAMRGHRGGHRAHRHGYRFGGMWGMGLGRDGQITKAQFEERSKRMFGWLDLNGDGVITPDELPTRRGRRAR